MGCLELDRGRQKMTSDTRKFCASPLVKEMEPIPSIPIPHPYSRPSNVSWHIQLCQERRRQCRLSTSVKQTPVLTSCKISDCSSPNDFNCSAGDGSGPGHGVTHNRGARRPSTGPLSKTTLYPPFEAFGG